jgi:threonine/homoserine/homoserine lactone efflux protein
MNLFVKGLIVGFCLAAPVGPIAAICVQRTISKRLISGILSGMGAAVADAVYGAIAAFGANIIAEFIIAERSWLQRIGGAILILLGLRLIFFTKVEERKNGVTNRGLFGDFFSTFVLTLTNPMTFVAFAAIFTTMGIGAVRGHSILTAELVGGVFAGSALWWLILSSASFLLRNHFDFRKLSAINKATGVFVIAVGVLYLFVLKPGADEATPIQRLVPHELKARTPTAVP